MYTGTRDEAALRADSDWQALITQLSDDVDHLVERFLLALGSVEDYGGGVVDATDVRATALLTLGMLTRRLSGAPLTQEQAIAARALGVRRARQGVGRDSLLDAVRMDFRVIWSALMEIAGEDMSAVLVRNVGHVFATVEEYVNEVQDAYLGEIAILTRDSRLYTSRFVAQLFSSGASRTRSIDEIARGLGVAIDEVFDVVHVGQENAAQLQQALAQGVVPHDWFVIDRAGGYVLFRARSAGHPRAIDLPNEISGGIVRAVPGLKLVPEAAVTAERLSRYSRALSGGLVGWDRGWLAAAADLLAEQAPGFGDTLWAALDDCTPHERARLIETVGTYCRTGSVKETAGALYCHRNTIVNRLQAFRDLSGLDVTKPLEASAALLALARRPAQLPADYARIAI